MDKRLQEAVLAVAFCILVGPFVGWFAETYLSWHWLPAWVAAVVLSGVIVYLTCDVAGLKAAVPKAWSYAVNSSPWSRNALTRRQWRFFRWHLPRALLSACSLASWVVLVLDVPLVVSGDWQCVGLTLVLLLACFLVLTLMVATALFNDDLREVRWASDEMKLIWVVWYRHMNPITVLGYYLPLFLYLLCRKLLPGMVRATPGTSRLVLVFFGHMYVLIHSQLRVLALVDTAIFVGTFYFTYSPIWALASAMAGAAWFAFNYVFIAQRILKVRPA